MPLSILAEIFQSGAAPPKDFLDRLPIYGGIVTVIVGIITLFFGIQKFRSESQLTREQRTRDLRWKQAEAAKSLNDEMLEDPESEAATKMLDFPHRKFKIPATKEKVPVDYDDIRRVLDPTYEPTDEKDLHIRDCFDSLFYYFATFEHYIASTLILPADVEYPLDYYLTLLVELRAEVNTYLRTFDLHRAEAFLRRYPIWIKPTPTPPPPTTAPRPTS